MMFHETPMLLSAPPFAHELPRPALPPNVLLTIHDGAGRAGAGRDEVVELADRAAADVGAEVVAHVVEEARVDDLEASALRVDRAAAAAVVRALGNALRVAVDEGDVLHDELYAGVGVAVARTRRVHLRLVAGGHVEDADLPAAAQRHLVAAVDDELGSLVVEDLRRRREDDRHRIGSAVERDDAAFRDRATNASPVQLAGVPVPMTVVGDDTSSAWPRRGRPRGRRHSPRAGRLAGSSAASQARQPSRVDPPAIPLDPPAIPLDSPAVPLDPPGAAAGPSSEPHAAEEASATTAAVRTTERVSTIAPRYRALRSSCNGASRPRCADAAYMSTLRDAGRLRACLESPSTRWAPYVAKAPRP